MHPLQHQFEGATVGSKQPLAVAHDINTVLLHQVEETSLRNTSKAQH